MRTTIVLVHGAFAESASWDGVIEPLVAEGHRVVAAPNPLRGLAADAASVSDIVRTIEGPVVLVAHSYGGAVISNVDPDAGEIVGLVYVNGFAPEPVRTASGSRACSRAACSARKRCGRFRAATGRPTSTSPRRHPHRAPALPGPPRPLAADDRDRRRVARHARLASRRDGSPDPRGRGAPRDRLKVFRMRRDADPLALEPLGPMGPIADAYPPSDPLALDPLSPVESDARAIGTKRSSSEDTSER